jgi:ribosomal protein L4
VQKTKVVNSNGVNVYDLIWHEKIVLSKAAVEELNELLSPKGKKTAVKEAA